MEWDFQQLPLNGMTAEEVLTLWQQGELFCKVKKETNEEKLNRCRQEALAYVKRIEIFATATWQPNISKFWQALICDEAFSNTLVMQKGSMKGKLNRYIITNMVFHLKVLGIYESQNFIELHKQLEGVQQKNGIYKNATIYSLNSTQRKRLHELYVLFRSLK